MVKPIFVRIPGLDLWFALSNTMSNKMNPLVQWMVTNIKVALFFLLFNLNITDFINICFFFLCHKHITINVSLFCFFFLVMNEKQETKKKKHTDKQYQSNKFCLNTVGSMEIDKTAKKAKLKFSVNNLFKLLSLEVRQRHTFVLLRSLSFAVSDNLSTTINK